MRLLKQPVYFSIICGLALGGILVFVINNKAIISQLHSWKILPREERLTEFYFTDHAKLPDSFRPGERQKVRFAIENLEQQSIHYRYKIIASAKNKQWVLQHGKVHLPNKGLKKVTKKIVLPPTKKRIKLQVDIEYESQTTDDKTEKQHQSIYYWMKKSK